MPTPSQQIESHLHHWRTHTPQPLPELPFRNHLNSLTKPQGSLGRLEDLAAQLQTLEIHELRPAAYLFAADHGIAAESVSLYPQEVTRQMLLNFLTGGAALNVLARLNQVPVHLVNAGIATPLDDHPNLRNTPIRPGSRNMLHTPALTQEDLAAAFTLGQLCADEAQANGYTIIASGEMGIANTTSASALTAALTGRSPEEVTGSGTGLSDASRLHKIDIVRKILKQHAEALTTPLEILRHFGGLEIGTLTAFYLALAAHGIAILLDGFIATAAAALALTLNPTLHPWLIAAHRSEEPGHRILLGHMHLTPILTLDMRLGEASGALVALPILHAAHALYHRMATFTSAQVSTPH